MNLMRSFAVALLLSIVLVSFGCNTFRGLGRDVEEGGETIQDVAEEAKPSNN